MARGAYEDEIIISWVELHRDARYLSEVLHQKGAWKGIIAVTRGGLVPAALVARELDIRLIDTICVTSYDAGQAGVAAQHQGTVQVLKGVQGQGDGYLLIDDLVDTGTTAQEFKQNKWIHFPWDIEYSFATPIKDGGRVAAGP
jgi:xanthine phosphoribosyltransferase